MVYNENDLYLLFLLGKRGTQSLKEAEEHCTVDAIGQCTRSDSPAHTGKTVNAMHVLIDKVSRWWLVVSWEDKTADCNNIEPHKQIWWAMIAQMTGQSPTMGRALI